MGIEVQFNSALNQFADTLNRQMKNRMTRACQKVQGKAVDLIRNPSSGGRTYKRGGVTHMASPPGAPPNADTGQLMKSIAYQVSGDGTEGVIGTPLTYGLLLEMGTSRMAPRPWLQPALDQSRDEVKKILGERLNNANT